MIVPLSSRRRLTVSNLFPSSRMFRANIDGSGRQKLTPVDSSAFTILNGIKVYKSDLYRQSLGEWSTLTRLSKLYRQSLGEWSTMTRLSNLHRQSLGEWSMITGNFLRILAPFYAYFIKPERHLMFIFLHLCRHLVNIFLQAERHMAFIFRQHERHLVFIWLHL